MLWKGEENVYCPGYTAMSDWEICFSMQRNWAILLCCGYKKGISQSSTKASSRQSTIFDLHLGIFLQFFCSLTFIMSQAGNFVVRSENINDKVWTEIASVIRRDADYLFKIIGKAYAILSNPTMVRATEFSVTFWVFLLLLLFLSFFCWAPDIIFLYWLMFYWNNDLNVLY